MGKIFLRAFVQGAGVTAGCYAVQGAVAVTNEVKRRIAEHKENKELGVVATIRIE